MDFRRHRSAGLAALARSLLRNFCSSRSASCQMFFEFFDASFVLGPLRLIPQTLNLSLERLSLFHTRAGRHRLASARLLRAGAPIRSAASPSGPSRPLGGAAAGRTTPAPRLCPQLVGQFSSASVASRTGTNRGERHGPRVCGHLGGAGIGTARRLRLRRHDHRRRWTTFATLIRLCRRDKGNHDDQTCRYNHLSRNHVDTSFSFLTHDRENPIMTRSQITICSFSKSNFAVLPARRPSMPICRAVWT